MPDDQTPSDISSDEAMSHYDLHETLGAGAMGEIWLARDTGLRRQVAYKRMLPEIASQRQALARFLREMQITAQLDHPHIVPVYECELNPDGSLAYAMKLVRGKTLKDLLVARKSQLAKSQDPGPECSRARLLDYFLSVCDAVHFAHSKGVIHRDLKPVNLMIGEFGEVYVMDWGIARRIGGGDSDEAEGSDAGASIGGGLERFDATIDVDETRAGQILGTPRYMSPQQAAGKNKELDGRSDQFALGLILFEILTLRPAFAAPNAVELIKKVLKVETAPFEPAEGDDAIPRELKAICHKALARKPEQRYGTVAELAADLRRWQQGLAVSAAPDTPWQRAIRWIGQHREATLAAGFALMLLCLGALSLAVYSQQSSLARARAHNTYVNGLFSQVAQQSQRIDSHFLSMQGLLNQLSGAAMQYLEQGPKVSEPHYPQHPFTAPGQIDSTLYGGRISLDWATSGFSPGKSIKDMNGKLERLLPLRHVFREVLLRSQSDASARLGKAEADALIAGQGTPIMWAHVSLEEGVIYMFPGIGFNTPGYDARTRPFYTNTARKHGSFWGQPYYDPLSGALLPCTRALYDAQGRFLGVAGIDLRFQYVIDHLLTLKRTEVRRSYLLNAQGEIVIRSQGSEKKSDSLTKGFETPPYPDAALQAAIKAKAPGGYFEESHQLLLYSRLNTLGWYLVVESAPQAGEAGETDGTP